MAKHSKRRDQAKAIAAVKAAAAKKRAEEGEDTTVPVWLHPQHGVRIQFDSPRGGWNRDGLPVVPWTTVTRLDIIKRDKYSFTIVSGQKLPKGFLWGQRDKQNYGLSGPYVAYAPLTRRCRDCKAMYTWSAEAQKHLYETLGVFVDKTATRCQACARKRRAIESARAAYAKAVAELPAETAAPYVRVAKAMLDVLEAGGTLSIDRAIGYCTRARKLGAKSSVDGVEAKLRARR